MRSRVIAALIRAAKFALPIAAIWAAWQRLQGRPIRVRLGDAWLAAAGVGTYYAVRSATNRVRRDRAIARLPDGLAFGSIALTFDDGPCPDTTPLLLDALHESGAKATFFVLLNNVARNPDLVRRIAAEGHTIGVHGIVHDAMGSWTERQVEHALKMMLREIGPNLPSVRYFRPPYGSRSQRMQRAIDRMGLTMAMWSLDPKDYENPSPSELVERVRTRAAHGDIVLLHDCNAVTVEALPEILRRLRGRGFDMVRL